MIGSFLLVAAVAAGFPDWTGAVDKNHVGLFLEKHVADAL